MANVQRLKIPVFWFIAVAFVFFYAFKLRPSHLFIILAGIQIGWEYRDWIKIGNLIILVVIVTLAILLFYSNLDPWHAAAFFYGITGGIVFRQKIPHKTVIEGETS